MKKNGRSILAMRIVFLYTELADYTIACLRSLRKNAPDADILVIHFPVNSEAPFRFEFDGIGEFICVDRFANYNQFREKLKAFAPDKIICCGWIRKWYIRFCAEYRHKAMCILTVDNHWRNTVQQQILRLLSHTFFKRVFSKIWIPGEPQMIYAKKLGFDNNNIISGFYCCDLERYNAYSQRFREHKKRQFPQRFLCVARYIPSKNYELLWKAFINWKTRHGGEWELWCAGSGENFEQRIQHPAIRHLGFVQKNNWEDVIRQTGVFILPSFSEPWSVAVHEFAAAGYPLLLSNRVGAAGRFLTPENGMSFDPANPDQMENCFRAISSLNDDQLNKMGEISHRLAQNLNLDEWAESLLQAHCGNG